MEHFDLIVIGSGPGGEGAAMQAAKSGKKVALIEKNNRVGGACTHSCTIPSKVLRQSIQEYKEFKSNASKIKASGSDWQLIK